MDSSHLPGQDTSLEVRDNQELAQINLNHAIQRIMEHSTFLQREKDQLENLIRSLYTSAMPDFDLGAKHNPVFHHTQVLDNMVTIGIFEQLSYTEFKRAAVLALLHDIGNAVSKRKKVKNSEITENVKRLHEARDRKENVEALVSQLTEQARDAIAFRLEHMDHGPLRIERIRESLLAAGMLDEDIHYICRAVLVHDYPSIEQTLFELRREGIYTEHLPGQFLLRFDATPVGLLLTLLREADRMFMVTKQGVVKDLLDTMVIGDITPTEFNTKLAGNSKRHREEFRLYRAASLDDWRFVNFTLYRTKSGYELFELLSQQRFDSGVA